MPATLSSKFLCPMRNDYEIRRPTSTCDLQKLYFGRSRGLEGAPANGVHVGGIAVRGTASLAQLPMVGGGEGNRAWVPRPGS